MKSMMNIILAILLICPFVSCDETKEYSWNDSWSDVEQPQEPESQETPETPQEPESPQLSGLESWNDVTAEFGTLPEYMKVYRAKDKLAGKKAVAYIAVADMSKADWDVWSVRIKDGALTEQTDDAFRTPSEVYADRKAPVIINAGYFYYSGSSRYTASLAVRNSEVFAYNIGYEYKDGAMMLPARAVFRESADGTFDACWTYVKWDKKHYMYTAPSDDPSKLPSADYPAGGKEFEARNAIGGGPVLVNEGRFTDSYVQEVFYGINPDTDQPRTAVGVTADGQMVFFVCEGREMTSGVKGLRTADVAEVLMDLGCVEAINLDGGGSSCMLINGKETIKVSDGKQRAVASAIMFK